MNNYRNAIILLLAGALVVTILFLKCGHDPVKPTILPTKDIVREAVKNEQVNTKSFDSLKARASFYISLSSNLMAIHQMDSVKLSTAQHQVKEVTRQFEVVLNNPGVSTAEIKTEYDHVSEATQDLNKGYDLTILNLNDAVQVKDNLLKVKDLQLSIKDTSYAQLKRSFYLCIDQQDKLNVYSKQLKKQVNRKKAAIIIWKVAAIAGGLFVLKSNLK